MWYDFHPAREGVLFGTSNATTADINTPSHCVNKLIAALCLSKGLSKPELDVDAHHLLRRSFTPGVVGVALRGHVFEFQPHQVFVVANLIGGKSHVRRKDGVAAEGSNGTQLRFPRNVQACCYESNRPDSSRFMVMRSRRATGVYGAQMSWRSTRTVYVEDRRHSVERSDRPTKTCPHSTKQPLRRGCRQAQVF